MNGVQENMDLSKTISYLAAANQQLAAAHNLALGHMQWLFTKYKKPIDYTDEGAAKCGKSKTSCSNCTLKEKKTDKNKKGTTRVILRNQNVTIKTMNKKLRRLRKLQAFDKTEDVDAEIMNINDVEDGHSKETEELNTLKTEWQIKNDKLINDLEEQRLVIERLKQDIEDSQQKCEEKEKNLERMSQKLNKSELESGKLLTRLKTFQIESLSAEKMVKEEVERNESLRARLAEEGEEKKRQLQALDEATQQIRALELTLKTNDQSSSRSKDHIPEESESEASCGNENKSASSANEEFKKELLLKREARQRAMAVISSEMDRLRQELEAEKVAHSETAQLLENLKQTQIKSVIESKTEANNDLEKTDQKTLDRVEALRLSDLLKISDEVASDLLLQLERTDDLRFQLENDPTEHRVRIASLKRMSEETRTMLRSRKQQVNTLKDRLAQILVRLGDRCFLSKSDDVKEEIDRQIEDIAHSRSLCDERLRILAELKDHCFKEIHELRLEIDIAKKDKQSIEEDLRKTEDKIDTQDAEIFNLESQLGLAKADCRDLQNQMSVINSLFTQMLLGASSAEMNLDRLTQLLQENHDLISGVAKENGTEAAALPKLLLDIIEQVDGRSREMEEKKDEEDLQEENIAHNLPKVWRVLLELLSCHAANSSSETPAEPVPDSCYKSVDTPAGPRLVISVSKTYIRLKDLILEKKHLEKEMNRMKQLNTHLDTKLSEQEKRLSAVSDELSKTWNVVGRMQEQHQQLHTHEKILRYELQQKRKMLQELKKELEYCREKWQSARQKNTNTEHEWKCLRREFAARKALASHDSFNNSGESGFSDEQEEESDEDDENVAKRSRPINSRKRSRKDGSRAITPDTESELPTDNEITDSKSASSSTSGQQTPTPENEAELENSELTIKTDNIAPIRLSDKEENSDKEILDPLDNALTKVIQNLIERNESEHVEPPLESKNNGNVDGNSNFEKATKIGIEKSNAIKTNIEENTIHQVTPTVLPISVFSIGPIPNSVAAVKNVQFSNPLIIGPSSILPENLSKVNLNTGTSSAKENTQEKMVEVNNVFINYSSSLETIREFSKNDNESNSSSSIEAASLLNVKDNETIIEEKTEGQLNSNDLPSSEVLDARAERLRRLEEQTEWLVKKVSDTNRRGSVLSSRLEELHETYSLTPVAPPMPDILPTFRLQTEIENNSTETECNEKADDASL